MSNFFVKLVQNNTGISSKNFFLVVVTIVGVLLLLVPVVVLVVEVCYNHTIVTDLTGLAAYIGSVASLFATAGVTKAWADMNENKNNAKDSINAENSILKEKIK